MFSRRSAARRRASGPSRAEINPPASELNPARLVQGKQRPYRGVVVRMGRAVGQSASDFFEALPRLPGVLRQGFHATRTRGDVPQFIRLPPRGCARLGAHVHQAPSHARRAPVHQAHQGVLRKAASRCFKTRRPSLPVMIHPQVHLRIPCYDFYSLYSR